MSGTFREGFVRTESGGAGSGGDPHVYPDIASFQSAIDAGDVEVYGAGFVTDRGGWWFNRDGVPAEIREVVWSSGAQVESLLDQYGYHPPIAGAGSRPDMTDGEPAPLQACPSLI